jgi:hypothetical protein
MHERGRYNDGGRPFFPQIECIAGVADLYSESEEHGSSRAVKETADKERICESFTQRIIGRTPAEHQDMVWQQMANEARIQSAAALSRLAEVQAGIQAIQSDLALWQKAQAEQDSKFQMRLAALEQVRHNENVEVAKDAASGTNWQAIGTVWAAIISLIALLVAIYK